MKASRTEAQTALGRMLVDRGVDEELQLRALLPRSPPDSAQHAEAKRLMDEILLSFVHYVLAVMQALYGKSRGWAARKSEVEAFARGALPELLRTYARCVRNGRGEPSCCRGAPALQQLGLSQEAVSSTCEHALQLLRSRTADVKLRPNTRARAEAQATSAEALGQYAAVLRAFVQLQLQRPTPKAL